MKVERVDTVRCRLGEGAMWDAAAGVLYFLDIYGQAVFGYRPADGTTRSWKTGGQVGAIALSGESGAVLAVANRICTLDFETGTREVLSGPLFAGEGLTVNDGAADRQGRFVFGGCWQGMEDPQPFGGLYRLDPDRTITELDTGVHQSNGHCFSPDGMTLYCADSFLHTMYAYDYDPASGAVSGKRVFAHTKALGGVPDGSTVDADGTVWMALFRAGKIAAFRADGSLQQLVDVPASLPSSVAFGGPSLDVLYVTTIDPAEFGWTGEEGGGHVYAIEGLARGVEEGRYAG
jgi:sugar lactone lactonase YvrE